jgi:hypothetical protein
MNLVNHVYCALMDILEVQVARSHATLSKGSLGHGVDRDHPNFAPRGLAKAVQSTPHAYERLAVGLVDILLVYLIGDDGESPFLLSELEQGT